MQLSDLKKPLSELTDEELLAHIAEIRRLRRNANRKTKDTAPEPEMSLDYLQALLAEDEDE